MVVRDPGGERKEVRGGGGLGRERSVLGKRGGFFFSKKDWGGKEGIGGDWGGKGGQRRKRAKRKGQTTKSELRFYEKKSERKKVK